MIETCMYLNFSNLFVIVIIILQLVSLLICFDLFQRTFRRDPKKSQCLACCTEPLVRWRHIIVLLETSFRWKAICLHLQVNYNCTRKRRHLTPICWRLVVERQLKRKNWRPRFMTLSVLCSFESRANIHFDCNFTNRCETKSLIEQRSWFEVKKINFDAFLKQVTFDKKKVCGGMLAFEHLDPLDGEDIYDQLDYEHEAIVDDNTEPASVPLCAICKNAFPGFILLPCRHQCVCIDCYRKWNQVDTAMFDPLFDSRITTKLKYSIVQIIQIAQTKIQFAWYARKRLKILLNRSYPSMIRRYVLPLKHNQNQMFKQKCNLLVELISDWLLIKKPFNSISSILKRMATQPS